MRPARAGRCTGGQLAAGTGRMAVSDGRRDRRGCRSSARSVPRRRLLEDERWLALRAARCRRWSCSASSSPIRSSRGILLSVTDSRGRRAGRVRRPRQFRSASGTTPIFHSAVYNTFLYTVVDDGLQAGARAVARAAAQPALQGQGARARLHPAAVHHPDGAVDLRLEMDVRPDLQRPQLGAVPARPDQRARSTGSATPTWRCARSSSSTSGAACRSSPSACSPGCRPSAPSCTRRRRSTARGRGSASGTSPGRCCCRSRWWSCCSR